MGGGLFKVGGQLGQSDSGHALQPGTLLDTRQVGRGGLGIRYLWILQEKQPKRLMSKETSGQDEIVD